MPSLQRNYAQADASQADDDAAARRGKKPYTAPHLTRLGRLEEGDPRRIAFSALGR